MKNADEKSLCPICGGKKTDSYATLTIDFDIGVLIVRHAPATRCAQCGEEWITDEVAQKIENFVEQAKASKVQLQIVGL